MILEALASGRPVVGSAVGGVPELLSKDNGLLAPAGDASGLAAAINEALNRQWDRLALRETVPCLSWSDVGCTYRDVLTAAINESPAMTKRTATVREEAT